MPVRSASGATPDPPVRAELQGRPHGRFRTFRAGRNQQGKPVLGGLCQLCPDAWVHMTAYTPFIGWLRAWRYLRRRYNDHLRHGTSIIDRDPRFHGGRR